MHEQQTQTRPSTSPGAGPAPGQRSPTPGADPAPTLVAPLSVISRKGFYRPTPRCIAASAEVRRKAPGCRGGRCGEGGETDLALTWEQHETSQDYALHWAAKTASTTRTRSEKKVFAFGKHQASPLFLVCIPRQRTICHPRNGCRRRNAGISVSRAQDRN